MVGIQELCGELLIKKTWVGIPAAPRISCLSLLPLGPDEVHKVPPRRTHPGGQKHTSGRCVCQVRQPAWKGL